MLLDVYIFKILFEGKEKKKRKKDHHRYIYSYINKQYNRKIDEIKLQNKKQPEFDL